MATETKVEILARLDVAVEEAYDRRKQIERDQSEATAAFKAARSNLVALEERSGEGEDVSTEIVDAEEAIAATQKIADVRFKRNIHEETSEGKTHTVEREGEWVPDLGVWTARLAGAQAAIEQAESRRDDFGLANFAALAAEEVPLDEPAGLALRDALQALLEAHAAFEERRRRWLRLAPYGDIPEAEIPVSPVAGLTAAAKAAVDGVETPTPRPLVGSGQSVIRLS